MDFLAKTGFLVDFRTFSIHNPTSGLSVTAKSKKVSSQVFSLDVREQMVPVDAQLNVYCPDKVDHADEMSYHGDKSYTVVTLDVASEAISERIGIADHGNTDSLDEKDEMFSPSKPEKTWPVEDSDMSTLHTLDIGDKLFVEERNALFTILKGCDQAFPKIDDKLGH